MANVEDDLLEPPDPATWGAFKRWVEQQQGVNDDTPLSRINIQPVLRMFAVVAMPAPRKRRRT